MFPVLYTTQVISFAISKARNSAVCNLLIYLEFVLHIVYENWAFSFVSFLFCFLAIPSTLFCTIAISVPQHPDKKCNFTWLLCVQTQ